MNHGRKICKRDMCTHKLFGNPTRFSPTHRINMSFQGYIWNYRILYGAMSKNAKPEGALRLRRSRNSPNRGALSRGANGETREDPRKSVSPAGPAARANQKTSLPSATLHSTRTPFPRPRLRLPAMPLRRLASPSSSSPPLILLLLSFSSPFFFSPSPAATAVGGQFLHFFACPYS